VDHLFRLTEQKLRKLISDPKELQRQLQELEKLRAQPITDRDTGDEEPVCFLCGEPGARKQVLYVNVHLCGPCEVLERNARRANPMTFTLDQLRQSEPSVKQ
jgi:hypothetical protein